METNRSDGLIRVANECISEQTNKQTLSIFPPHQVRVVFLQWLPWILRMGRPGEKITRFSKIPNTSPKYIVQNTKYMTQIHHPNTHAKIPNTSPKYICQNTKYITQIHRPKYQIHHPHTPSKIPNTSTKCITQNTKFITQNTKHLISKTKNTGSHDD